MANNTITARTSLVDAIIDNNHFANRKVTGEQIGQENLRNWKSLCESVRKNAYSIYASLENQNLCGSGDALDDMAEITEMSDTIVFDSLFASLRDLMGAVGPVNGHSLHYSKMFGILCIVYAGKRVNCDSPKLQLCQDMLRNRKRELSQMESINGINPEAIEEKKAQIKALEEEKNTLLATPDQRVKGVGRVSAEAFRLDLEHHLARMFNKQLAKSWDELEAEDEKRRQEKKARRAANKKEKQAKQSNAGRALADAKADIKTEINHAGGKN